MCVFKREREGGRAKKREGDRKTERERERERETDRQTDRQSLPVPARGFII